MSSLSDAQANQITRLAWAQIWGRDATDREALYAQAIARLETGYGRNGQFGVFANQGMYNWGALETAPKNGQCPPGTQPGNDQGSVCFYVYSSDQAAAAAFIRVLTKTHWPNVVSAMNNGTPLDVATALHPGTPSLNYYTGVSGSDDDRRHAYATAIQNSINAIGKSGVSIPDLSTPGSSSSSKLVPALLLLGAGALVLYGYSRENGTPMWLRKLGFSV